MDALRAAGMPVNPLVDLLTARAQAAGGSAANAKPQAAANLGAQFESLFVSLLLKEMRQSLETGSLFGEDTGDVLGGLFDTYLGEHLAQRGGLGIADMVNRQLAPPNRANSNVST